MYFFSALFLVSLREGLSLGAFRRFSKGCPQIYPQKSWDPMESLEK
jgi:hypothetical protein